MSFTHPNRPGRETYFTMRLACLILLFLVQSGIAGAPGGEDPLRDADAYIAKALSEWQVPGLAAAVVFDDEVVFARGYGLREAGKPGRVDERTLFAVASNSKAFTASLLGMLVDEGRLSWDDPVLKFLPGFKLHDPYVTREITIRDLLTHRSGLPTFGGDHLWIGQDLGREEMIRRLRFLKPSASFRSAYQYQNLMFMTAGEVIPAASGHTWDRMIRERILGPLGMKDTVTSVKDLKGQDNVATPHEVVDGSLVPVEYDLVDNIAAAGGLNSNVVDMAQWMRLNLNGGVCEGKRLLSEKTLREIQRIQFPLPVPSLWEKELQTRFNGYGLGWGVTEYRGYKLLKHGGGLSGMISQQYLLPEKKLGVIVLTNLAPGDLATALAMWLVDRFLGAPDRDWSTEFKTASERAAERTAEAKKKLEGTRLQGTNPSLPLQAYTGIYENDFSGKAEVRLEGGVLFFDYNPRHRGPLRHWHNDTFVVEWRHPIFDMEARTFLRFDVDERGEVTGLEVTFYHRNEFKKTR
jgi:CubicO group peptidase (beta-lactamase class C family)